MMIPRYRKEFLFSSSFSVLEETDKQEYNIIRITRTEAGVGQGVGDTEKTGLSRKTLFRKSKGN